MSQLLKTNYNLEERTTCFSEAVIDVCKSISKTIISVPIISQLIRATTSIGANYREANGASSRLDFRNKIYVCKKEAKETEYWLQLLAKADEKFTDPCRKLWKESHELTLIFSKIAGSLKVSNIKN